MYARDASLHCSGANSILARSAGRWSSNCEQTRIAATLRDSVVDHFQTVGHLKCTLSGKYKIFWRPQHGFERTPSNPHCTLTKFSVISPKAWKLWIKLIFPIVESGPSWRIMLERQRDVTCNTFGIVRGAMPPWRTLRRGAGARSSRYTVSSSLRWFCCVDAWHWSAQSNTAIK